VRDTGQVELRVSDEPAVPAAKWIARRLQSAVRRRGRASLALSGGSTAPALIAALADHDVELLRQ
jgi:6-phosphogluconolactonase/glucosamine-6-phosphate isomerase/deaminase